jgi:hypothetical protein
VLCLLKVLSRDAVPHNTSYRIKKYKKLVSLLLAIIEILINFTSWRNEEDAKFKNISRPHVRTRFTNRAFLFGCLSNAA